MHSLSASKEVDWDSYPWMGVLPPNRPDEENLALMTLCVEQLKRRDHAIVLGSTPEYRHLLAGRFDQVTVIDSSPAFNDGVTWMAGGRAENEVSLNLDWLCMAEHDLPRADFVASHFTHGNIEFARRSDFFRSVAAILTPDGYFFDTIFQPTSRLNSIEYLDDKYRDAPINLRVLNDLSCEAVFLGEYLGEVGRVDSDLAAAWVTTSTSSDWVRYLMHQVLRFIAPSGLSWDYSPDFPPDSLGYGDWLEVRQRAQPETWSVFEGEIEIRVSSPRLEQR